MEIKLYKYTGIFTDSQMGGVNEICTREFVLLDIQKAIALGLESHCVFYLDMTIDIKLISKKGRYAFIGSLKKIDNEDDFARAALIETEIEMKNNIGAATHNLR